VTERFVVGVVGQPFGLEGFVKVKPFSGDIENLLRLRELTLRVAGKERKLSIEESAAAPPAALLRFAGINTPEAAKTLGGAELLVEREQASPLTDGEFYVEDLKGLALVSAENGETLGHISAVVEGGGGDLLEIRLTDGELRLVPLRKEFFRDINPANGSVALSNVWILE
jgi:16S rRNA processing protein RimM